MMPSSTRVTERSGSRRHSAQIFSSSLSSMPPAKKRPRRSHLPSFRRVRECSVSTSDTVSSLPLWKSKKWKPSSSASTAPPFLRNASAPTSRLIDQFSALPLFGSRRQIECVLQCANHLGEGPVWDVEEGRLYWVDGTGRRVNKPSIWRLDPKSGKAENWSIKRDVGALALRKKGGAVLALADGFHFFDFQSGKLETVSLVDTEHSRMRLNDGKCDRRGRFFAGGMDDKEELKICALWRLDPDLSVTLVDDGIICSNGPCWSPDDKTFYFADTFHGQIWAYDYDP